MKFTVKHLTHSRDPIKVGPTPWDIVRQQKGLPNIISRGRISNLNKQEAPIWLACGTLEGKGGPSLLMGKYRKLAGNSWERVLGGGENVVFFGRE